VASGLILELCRCSGAAYVREERAPAATAARQIPVHLKELCAEALVGCLRNLFKNVQDHHHGLDVVPTDVASALRRRKQHKNVLRKGAVLFNQKPTAGIQFLSNEGVFPTPVKPKDVALFLRQGIALGLDKAAVGIYLGEVGKAPVAGKSPHDCERDWFHHKTLGEIMPQKSKEVI